MPTVVENIRKEKNANLCYVEDAMIGNGPFELSPEFAHFKVDLHCWTYHWSEEKKQKHLRQFHEAIPTDPLRIGTSKPGADHYNQEDELGLTEREEGKGKYVRTHQHHIHSPFLFAILAYRLCSHHRITKSRACFLAAKTS